MFDNKVSLLVIGVVRTFTITETWPSTEGLGSDDVKGVTPLAGLDMLEGVAVGVGRVSGTGGGNTSITVT